MGTHRIRKNTHDGERRHWGTNMKFDVSSISAAWRLLLQNNRDTTRIDKHSRKTYTCERVRPCVRACVRVCVRLAHVMRVQNSISVSCCSCSLTWSSLKTCRPCIRRCSRRILANARAIHILRRKLIETVASFFILHRIIANLYRVLSLQICQLRYFYWFAARQNTDCRRDCFLISAYTFCTGTKILPCFIQFRLLGVQPIRCDACSWSS